MANISRYARGFLNLLGLQNFGEAPKQVGGMVVPTVEIGDLYLADAQETRFGGTAGNLVDGFNDAIDSAGNALVVPANEIWRVVIASGSVVPAAGATGKFAIAVQVDANTIRTSLPVDYVASTRTHVIQHTSFWAIPGYRLGFENRQTVGNAPASLQLLIARLRG